MLMMENMLGVDDVMEVDVLDLDDSHESLQSGNRTTLMTEVFIFYQV